MCGFVVDKSGVGAGFLRVLRFPLPILILPTAPHSSPSIIDQIVADVRSGLSLAPPKEIKKIVLNNRYPRS
jgi:hypothetical protein